MLGLLGSVAEFESAIIRERQAEGITNADVAHAPTFPEVYTEFAARVDGMVLGAVLFSLSGPWA